MTNPIQIAVVGHTNAGKTSLLRTLTRHVDFGAVSDRPGTTRHVESIDLMVDGVSVVRFFDTPGLEDSIALHDYVKSLEDCATPPDRIRAFLKGPEASRSFEQEAKVLRQLLQVEAALYVVDTREPVLPKFLAEIEILASCAKPLMPVLNFVRDPDSRRDDWVNALSAYGLHATIQFDAVAPFVGSESQLYQDLATLVRARRERLLEVVKDLELQRLERRSAACRVVADLLVSMAALRREIRKEDLEDPLKKQAFIEAFRGAVLVAARRSIDALLAIYGFRESDADDAVLPWVAGRWEDDLFNAETLRDAGKALGKGAAFGAAIGLTADIALAGLSLGAGTALGAALGGMASQGWGQVGRKMLNKARGVHELTLENEVLFVLAGHMGHLLRALEQRGHAAIGKIAAGTEEPPAMRKPLTQLIDALQPARSHPEWERGKTVDDDRRRAFVAAIADAVSDVVMFDGSGSRSDLDHSG